jgi:hypothetical protein
LYHWVSSSTLLNRPGRFVEMSTASCRAKSAALTVGRGGDHYRSIEQQRAAPCGTSGAAEEITTHPFLPMLIAQEARMPPARSTSSAWPALWLLARIRYRLAKAVDQLVQIRIVERPRDRVGAKAPEVADVAERLEVAKVTRQADFCSRPADEANPLPLVKPMAPW